MKTKSKAELKQEIDALQAENTKLSETNERIQREQWEKRIPQATAEFHVRMNKTFPNMVTNVRFEHVDASGYWFTFELSNDKRRQTYAVRHTEI